MIILYITDDRFNTMRKYFFILLILFAGCGTSQQEIEQQRLDSIRKADSIAVIKLYELERKRDDSIIAASDKAILELEKQKKEKLQIANKANEEEYLKYFQSKWDRVKLKNDGDFPQYENYFNELGDIDQEMYNLFQKNPSYSKIEKLRKKFTNSNKMKKATNDYLTYGQINYYNKPVTLKLPCQLFLAEYLHNPESLEIQDYGVIGKTKNGWKVIMTFRATNAFGALVLNQMTFDIRFNPIDNTYYVHNAY